MKEFIKRTLTGLILPIGILLAWHITVTYGSIPAGILPGIDRVIRVFSEMLHNGQLAADLSASLSCVLRGYLISAVLGIVLGSFMGMSKTIKELLLPTVTVIRQIPMIAWIPLVILWFGIGDITKTIVIVLAAFFPVLVNTQSGIETTPKGYTEVAQLYRLNPVKTFLKVYLPHALPQILVGLRLGLGISWMAVVGAELIASTTGIGYRMSYARSMMRADIVIMCMIVVGIIGIVMDKLLGIIFQAATPWNHHK